MNNKEIEIIIKGFDKMRQKAFNIYSKEMGRIWEQERAFIKALGDNNEKKQ